MSARFVKTEKVRVNVENFDKIDAEMAVYYWDDVDSDPSIL